MRAMTTNYVCQRVFTMIAKTILPIMSVTMDLLTMLLIKRCTILEPVRTMMQLLSQTSVHTLVLLAANRDHLSGEVLYWLFSPPPFSGLYSYHLNWSTPRTFFVLVRTRQWRRRYTFTFSAQHCSQHAWILQKRFYIWFCWSFCVCHLKWLIYLSRNWFPRRLEAKALRLTANLISPRSTIRKNQVSQVPLEHPESCVGSISNV